MGAANSCSRRRRRDSDDDETRNSKTEKRSMSNAFTCYMPKCVNVLLLGLDNAGKTTLYKTLRGEPTMYVDRTAYATRCHFRNPLNKKRTEKGFKNVNMIDSPGLRRYRTTWPASCSGAWMHSKVLFYVVD
jgi:GTPase SAR1 family protein